MNAQTLPPPAPALRPRKELLIAWTLLLLRDIGETHGYTLHQELLARGLGPQATSVYRRLAKFERDRWVVSRWSGPVQGPRRHVYQLTEDGRSALLEVTNLIAATRDAYDTFLDAHARAVSRRADGAGADEGATPAARERMTSLREDRAAPRQTPSSRQPLHPHKELLVGWLLLHLDAGATYGYDLRRAFAAQLLSPDPGAVYRMLRQLEADRWVQSRWLRPVAGPRRRFYRLTGRGRRNLDEIARLIATMRDAHDTYLRSYTDVKSTSLSGTSC